MNKMSWVMLYTIAGEVGLFAAVSYIPILYTGTKNLIYGSDINRLDKKIEMLLQQNKSIKMELNKMKDITLINDSELKELNYDIVTTYDYIDFD